MGYCGTKGGVKKKKEEGGISGKKQKGCPKAFVFLTNHLEPDNVASHRHVGVFDIWLFWAPGYQKQPNVENADVSIRGYII